VEVGDRELVRCSQKGDEEAFRELVQRYEKRAYWVAYNMVRSHEEACDIIQEAFLRVYRSINRFNLKMNFYTWLYQIVMNLSIDRLRRQSIFRPTSLDSVGERGDSHEAPDVGIERIELREKVRRLLDKLAPKYKAVITLRDIEGLSCKEIAQIVGCTHATVRWRLHRARLIFKKLLDKDRRGEAITRDDKTPQERE
jgi:RNA polymerase sigma-70 factor (ECF subfamily)